MSGISDFFVKALSDVASSVVSSILGWWDRKRLEAEAQRAQALEQQVAAIKENRIREDALRDEAQKEAIFSYEEWEKQP